MTAELDLVVLTESLPDHHLEKGDVGTIVQILETGKAYEVEFVTLSGRTIALLTLTPSQLRAVGAGDLLHVRANPEFALAA